MNESGAFTKTQGPMLQETNKTHMLLTCHDDDVGMIMVIYNGRSGCV